MFLTPVIYPPAKGGVLSIINRFNPIHYLIDTPRTIFFNGTMEHPFLFAVISILSVIIFLGGWRFYHIAMGRIVEKV
jgi:ABC-type polysaccharide/polyol phosphate export permease